MSSSRKTSPRPQHQSSQAASARCANMKAKRGNERTAANEERCRGRCRVQWSEKHVKEGLVLVQEAQLARVVKTGPITEHYEVDPKPFASGQWAKVFRCRSRSTGVLYAAKYSSRSRFNSDCSAELRHEIALLSLCSQSPRVVRLHDVYETPKEIILIMEYAPGGDLQTLIDGDLVPLEGDVVHFVRQLVEGLAYLHERNIAHLDIKPQNLVMMGSFPECEVKLCDFEISRVILEGTEVREILGTPDYVAPEILHYEPITLAADMWSLGVTTYVLLTGFSPFGGETDQETFQNISLGEVDYPEELFEDVSAQAKDFVAKLLVLDPSARMTAKQCLRHEWLRGAPTQASPHLRRFLSKSREVLLERVVSRENLRRAALLSQTTSQANLSSDLHDQNQQSLQDCSLSQSEMCLSNCHVDNRTSLSESEGFPSPADSRTSLNSSRTSLSCASQSCLLNKEQTQGLLSRAQSRSQANLNHGLSRGLLSRIRSLNRVQSQVCLLNGSSSPSSISRQTQMITSMNPVISKSREKLYGLRSLSKSQGVLDIYRSLECLRRKGRAYQRAKTEDMLPIFKQLDAEIAASTVSIAAPVDTDTSSANSATPNSSQMIPCLKEVDMNIKEETNAIDAPSPSIKHSDNSYSSETGDAKEAALSVHREASKRQGSDSEENLDSLKSLESDTLTEDSDENPVPREAGVNLISGKRSCERQHSDVSSHSNNSVVSDDKEDRSTESETEEPKYTVAQLVSAFNKHQEIATRTSLKAIMTEKRINEVTFPTGAKALRLFIPDINITESTIVRRKTSYKPRKNWEELRKRNEKNEGVLQNFDNDSGNEDNGETEDGQSKTRNESSMVRELQNSGRMTLKDGGERAVELSRKESKTRDDVDALDSWTILQLEEISGGEDSSTKLDTTIDEKYRRCIKGAKEHKTDTSGTHMLSSLEQQPIVASNREKERLPNYIYPEMTCQAKVGVQETSKKPSTPVSRIEEKTQRTAGTKPMLGSDCTNVNLKDILQRIDHFQSTPKENMENLRKRTSIAKIILNDNLSHENQTLGEVGGRWESRAKSEPPSSPCQRETEDKSKLIVPPSFVRSSSLSSDGSCPTPCSVQSDTNVSWEDIQCRTGSSTSLEKEDTFKASRKQGIQRTSSEGRNKQPSEDRKLWGRVCTGSYTRAMERFTGKNGDASRKSIDHLNASESEKTRRKSSPAVPHYFNS
ncbi:hypothetical protein KM043_008213 [Ampulex compressa]|nr:hypothetical protein KM043_008213 [Ampulex compressa]